MAAVTSAQATGSTANTTSYACAAFTPTAGDLLVAIVTVADSIAVPTMSDSQGLGWTLIASALMRTSLDQVHIFVANAFAAAVSMTVTFDCTGDAATGAFVAVGKVSGMSRVGASAVRQSGVKSNSTGTPAANFGVGVCLTTNPVIAAMGNGTNPATMTPPTGFSERSDNGFATPNTGAEWASIDSGFTAGGVTWGSASASNYGAVVVELDVSAPPQVQPPRAMQQYRRRRVG